MFELTRKTKYEGLWMLVRTVLISILLIGIFILAVNALSKSADEKQLDMVEAAVRRSVMQCYALEGRYPPSLEYLQEEYGLLLYSDKYVYHYVPHAANLLPEIAVFSLEGEG